MEWDGRWEHRGGKSRQHQKRFSCIDPMHIYPSISYVSPLDWTKAGSSSPLLVDLIYVPHNAQQVVEKHKLLSQMEIPCKCVQAKDIELRK